jgi:predicted phosphodiesterase
MTTLLCASDIHDEKDKHAKLAEYSAGCDAVITAGDDFDRYTEQGPEANLLPQLLLQKHWQQTQLPREALQSFGNLLQRIDDQPPEKQKQEINAFLKANPDFVRESQRIQHEVKKGFLAHYLKRAKSINEHYRATGIPAVGTPGNHDPLPAIEQMDSVQYLLGDVADLDGVRIAGLPATGEWVPGALQLCPEFYPHLSHYSPHTDKNAQPSELAQKLLQHEGGIDVLVTHKAYRTDVQEWDKYYRKGEQLHEFGVDAGAVAVDKKFKPALNVFGHYHMDKAKVKRSEDGAQWFLYVGPNAMVRVELDDENKPHSFEGLRYN